MPRVDAADLQVAEQRDVFRGLHQFLLGASPAYIANAQVIVVRKDSGIQTLADLAGKVVALQAGW